MACDHLPLDDARQPHTGELGGFGAAALRYQGWGYRVLPLERKGKRPHRMTGDRGGVHWATADQRMPWWAWGRTDPAASVGIAAGGGLLVLDLDRKHGADGPGEFWRLVTEHRLPFPADVPLVRTPSGGYHLWLAADGAVPNRSGILPGVDVRGDGGIAVAPPSMAEVTVRDRPGDPGGTALVPYSWKGCPCALPRAPGWLTGWIASAPAAARETSTGGNVPDVADVIRAGVPVGQRNETFYRLACQLYRRCDGDEHAVMTALAQAWEATSHAGGFTWPEVARCAASAREFVRRSREAEAAQARAFLQMLGYRR